MINSVGLKSAFMRSEDRRNAFKVQVNYSHVHKSYREAMKILDLMQQSPTMLIKSKENHLNKKES